MMKRILMMIMLAFSIPSLSYRIEGGEYYVGGGFGATINVARFNDLLKVTPGVELPLVMNLDYALDKNWGVFGSAIPQFSVGSVRFLFRGGAKYWFNSFDAPFVPYVSLALTPSFLIPAGAPNHFNIGLSPGAGLNYFVLANFLVGGHIHFNPSIAFADGDKKFEFSVMGYFDVTLRL